MAKEGHKIKSGGAAKVVKQRVVSSRDLTHSSTPSSHSKVTESELSPEVKRLSHSLLSSVDLLDESESTRVQKVLSSLVGHLADSDDQGEEMEEFLMMLLDTDPELRADIGAAISKR